MSDKSPISSIGMRTRYFRKIKFGKPPISSHDRFSLAVELAEKGGNDNCQMALMLFDHGEDRNDARWLNLLGDLYQLYTPIRNTVYSTSIYEKAYKCGSRDRIDFLFHIYIYGGEGIEQDLEAAYNYLTQDTDRSYDGLRRHNTMLTQMLKSSNINCARTASENPRTSIVLDRVLEFDVSNITFPQTESTLQENIIRNLRLFARVLCDKQGSEDLAKVEKIYDFIFNLPNVSHTNEYSMAVRSSLAFAIIHDYEDEVVNSYTDIPFYSTCECDECQKSNAELVEYCSNFMETEQHIEAITFWRPLFSEEINPEKCFGHFEVRQVTYEHLVILKIISNIASWENWQFAREWNALESFCALKYNNLNPLSILSSTFEYGPFYNRLNQHGHPIIGSYEAVNYAGKEGTKFLTSGRNYFEGLEAKQGESINFRFTEGDINLITDEDIDTVLALAFSSSEFQWASIDVPSSQAASFFRMREKNTTPYWLLYTDFGRTLYATDVLAGELSWNFNELEFLNESLYVSKTFNKIASKLRSVENKYMEISASRAINVNPKSVSLQSSFKGDTFSVAVNAVKMGIDGTYVLKGGKIAHKNNPAYIHPQRTKILTEHYNELAFIIPAYERLRQLVAMQYVLKELIDHGYKPPLEIKQRAEEAQKRYIQRARSRKKDNYAFYLPCNSSLIR